jgi:hypothetical protein
MPHLPQAVGAHLCPAHCRASPTDFRRSRLAEEKRCTLDRLYQRIVDDLHELLRAIGLKVAAFCLYGCFSYHQTLRSATARDTGPAVVPGFRRASIEPSDHGLELAHSGRANAPCRYPWRGSNFDPHLRALRQTQPCWGLLKQPDKQRLPNENKTLSWGPIMGLTSVPSQAAGDY